MAIPTETAARQTQISSALDRQEALLESLASVVGGLETRIGGVLTSSNPSKEIADVDPELVDIARILQSNNLRLATLRDWIDEMYARVEL